MTNEELIEELADKPLPAPAEMDGQKFHVTPCIKSGFCCTTAPCAYGEIAESGKGCRYLTDPNELGQKMCGKYEWIKANVPNWMYYPAFGAGCCMSLGNDMRKKVIDNYKKQVLGGRHNLFSGTRKGRTNVMNIEPGFKFRRTVTTDESKPYKREAYEGTVKRVDGVWVTDQDDHLHLVSQLQIEEKI